MWYSVCLFNFSKFFLPLFSFLLKRPAVIGRINNFLARGMNIFLPMIIIVLFEALLRPFYPGYQSFIGDWANIAVHSFFFIFGFILSRSPEIFDLKAGRIKIFLIPAVCSAIIYLACKRFFFVEETYPRLLILSILWGISAYTWVLSLTGLSRKFLNRNSVLLKYLSKTSFSLYLFHYLIVSVFIYVLLKTGLPNYLIWIITTLGTYIVFMSLFELVLKRSKLIRYICGIANK